MLKIFSAISSAISLLNDVCDHISVAIRTSSTRHKLQGEKICIRVSHKNTYLLCIFISMVIN